MIISGTVLNSATGQPLPGALVVLQPGMRVKAVEALRERAGIAPAAPRETRVRRQSLRNEP